MTTSRALPSTLGPTYPTIPHMTARVRLAGMCGIVGYVGPKVDGRALEVVMEGLARLEYRGYDSAGVALVAGDHVVTMKRAGNLVNLIDALAEAPLPGSSTGIGHTRWATHGGPTDVN